MSNNNFTELLKQRPTIRRARHVHYILGDQLDCQAALKNGFDRQRDLVFMAEVAEEATHVASHQQRIVLFLAAMRHHAADLLKRGIPVLYRCLDASGNSQTLGGELRQVINKFTPEQIVLTQPGEHRVLHDLQGICQHANVPLKLEPDRSFTCTLDDWQAWSSRRKTLTMEYFYRERRRALDILMDQDTPVGGEWNYDRENRHAFKDAPQVRQAYRPRADAITQEVISIVQEKVPLAPGRLESFHWPVTRQQALKLLADFCQHRLSLFGRYEDAMWTDEPVLYHSQLSAALNLKLLHPDECISAALKAYDEGTAPLNSVEGFVRQIIGWREFIRGVYYQEGPKYLLKNNLKHRHPLPTFYWTGDTDMNCIRHCVNEVLDQAWAHHIPRLMVMGNFALLFGVDPKQVHEWFLGMFVDGVDWVTAPNVIGMSQHADNGLVGSKPYAASGKYIQRMSNYCKSCVYDPNKRSGDDACPFNVFYWEFLFRHQETFAGNPRMRLALNQANRLAPQERKQIESQAGAYRIRLS